MQYRPTLPEILALEPRRLFAAVYPSNEEQYLVELINRARANPAGEASRYLIDLNEGLAPGTISTAAKQPLAINPYLTDSAHTHSQWMIDNQTFSHTGAGGSQPQDRMTSAGYVFTGNWTSGENIGYRSSSSVAILTVQKITDVHKDLFVDSGIDGRGHRLNILDADFRELGGGVATGLFQGISAAMITEDFAASGTSVFLTGVVYNDYVQQNNLYSIGEGLSGVTITAKRISDNATFSTNTWSSGGYSLAVPAGTYAVSATGGSLGGIIAYNNVTVGTENVKRDFTTAMVQFATVVGGALTITGTTSPDSISVSYANNSYTVTRNGTATTLAGSSVTNILLSTGDGDDVIVLDPSVMVPAYVDAGIGNDKIVGGSGKDTLTGGASKDTIYGGLGDDRLNGNGGHDRVFGEAGKDRLYGGDGNDVLDGGSSTDRIWGDAGNDVVYGQSGNDYVYCRDTLIDTIYGGIGEDSAQLDLSDVHYSIETLLL